MERKCSVVGGLDLENQTYTELIEIDNTIASINVNKNSFLKTAHYANSPAAALYK